MEKFKSEKHLINKIEKEIAKTNKKKIYFFTGHFPIIYKKQSALEDFKIWEIFSKYSLEIACKLAKYAKTKKVKNHRSKTGGMSAWLNQNTFDF